MSNVSAVGRLPLDRYPIVHTDQLDEVRAAVRGYVGDHPLDLVDPTAPVDARIHARRIDRVDVSYLAFGAEAVTAPGDLGRYLVQLVVSGTYRVRRGDEEAVRRPGGVLVLSPDPTLRTHWSADCGVVAYTVPARHLVEHLGRLLRRHVTEPPRFEVAMDGGQGAGRPFVRDLLLPLTRRLNHDWGAIEDAAGARRVEDALLTALLRAQPNTYSEALERELGPSRP